MGPSNWVNLGHFRDAFWEGFRSVKGLFAGGIFGGFWEVKKSGKVGKMRVFARVKRPLAEAPIGAKKGPNWALFRPRFFVFGGSILGVTASGVLVKKVEKKSKNNRKKIKSEKMSKKDDRKGTDLARTEPELRVANRRP